MDIRDAIRTGKHRHRLQKRLFGPDMLVLQYQWRGTRFFMAGPAADSERVTFWRDARVEDLVEDPAP